MRRIVIIAHNLRSTYNVGSLLRTAEGLGALDIYLTGYTPYPLLADDTRLPHISKKIDAQICKISLGAEKLVNVTHSEDIFPLIQALKDDGFLVAALEQNTNSSSLEEFHPPDKLAIIIGREVEGIEAEILGQCDLILEIPMFGKKESFNVIQATAMALS